MDLVEGMTLTKLVVIPVCNFWDLIPSIITFYRRHLDEAKILIVNDCRRKSVDVSMWKNVEVVKSSYNKGLKGSLQTAYDYDIANVGSDVMIINEHDVIVNEITLYASLHLFENPVFSDFASVSPVYMHDKKMCYPSHPNWYKDKPQVSRADIGRIAKVMSQGVPFGFSLWRPNVFKDVVSKKFPNTWKLDYKFGKYVYEELGLCHMRMLDYYVEHFNEGVNSWKKRKE